MTTTEKNTSALLHLSSLTQFIIPFGNFIFPIIIWSSKKNESEFVDYNGKQVINFQLSLLLYNLIGFVIAGFFAIYYLFNVIKIKNIENIDIEFNHYANSEYISLILIACIALGVFAFSKIAEFVLIIIASVKASNGEKHTYPLTINFLK
jgi:uncharacterized protein